MNDIKKINIGSDFSRYPAGRFKSDGDFNGELFRDKFLIPALENQEYTLIELDDTAGYGSSFLEEAFGGLVRKGFSADKVKKFLSFFSDDESLKEEIEDYINDAESE